VVTPILPGDSLLFAAGSFAALGALDVSLLFVLLSVAAILGDTANYAIGHYLGPKVFHYERSRFFDPDHLRKTHRFYEKYGGKTIIIARFVPIVRTFAPFVAGIGAMTYWRFLAYNVIGGVLWVAVCLFAGYFFGNLPIVKKNFSLAIIAIVILSVMPAVIEYVRHRREAKRAAAAADAGAA
jgi:membrane-associated protein